ncbi:peptidyl-tRNA hydrolase [Melghiribacillus thermohalophilus]|uniref:Peptidyl-tRNA hydrolase n=1 Tax=Melghiribacillus thermohalophilus TaxID=1324956 RepID=A0A4R3MRL3_9BACI|nr:aminoacyl-tRNA hydrolase [Melghiribacillus thermohalophilus]TCT18160.1 peptidyl-tRNA hydrolase [Melghiribacillus thermohalophilus]
MKCIVGLGNPGVKYEKTRHNIGFMVIDELLQRHQWTLDKEKFKALYTIETYRDEKVMLVKPLTYMNLSGEAVRPILDYYDIDLSDLLVIYDDLDLPPGKIRLRQKGGHGGHNGIRNMIDHLDTKSFKRIRIGVGKPAGATSVVDHVLGSFTSDEQPLIDESIQKAADACEIWTEKTFAEVMNIFN